MEHRFFSDEIKCKQHNRKERIYQKMKFIVDTSIFLCYYNLAVTDKWQKTSWYFKEFDTTLKIMKKVVDKQQNLW